MRKRDYAYMLRLRLGLNLPDGLLLSQLVPSKQL